jgi:hypothetical protein
MEEVSCLLLDLDFLAMGRLGIFARYLSWLHWLGGLLEQLVQVGPFEQPVAIHRIPVHW